MAYGSSYDSPFRSSVTPWVARLLVANTAVFLVVLLLSRTTLGPAILDFLWLDRDRLLVRPWTPITYAFTHMEVFHYLFNMLGLFFLGPPLEDRWGGKAFIRFYLVAALGGAVLSLFLPGRVLGASGAVNGLLLAWALIWPNAQIYLFGVIPVKVKGRARGSVVLSLMTAAGGGGGGVAHFAHLGGFLAAFLYLKSPWAPSEWGEVPARPSKRRKKENALAAWVGKKRSGPQPVASTPVTPHPSSPARRSERELLDDVDRILDKISAQGLGSLTDDERKRLDEVSRRYRTN
ncbi:MAG: rhomboid family intramembrane serine protease [Gemmatimonadetes bacterium]|nr:rhomboid family intramembrane serine protease [Gemmatimonadota bacterium]